MEALRRLSLRRRARAITVRSIAFAAKLRARSSEFVTDAWQPFESLGDELATLAITEQANERERRAIIHGLKAGLRRVGLTESVRDGVLARLSPRIMAGATAHVTPLQRLAV